MEELTSEKAMKKSVCFPQRKGYWTYQKVRSQYWSCQWYVCTRLSFLCIYMLKLCSFILIW